MFPRVFRHPGFFSLFFLWVASPAVAGDVVPSLTPPRWKELAGGVAFARVEATRYCRLGSVGIAAVRLDPTRCRIEPYHENEFSDRATILDWEARLKAPVILNAGLYDTNRRHLGTLRRQGRDLGGSRHVSWKGELALEPREEGLLPAVLLDLSLPEDIALETKYATAVQSMMLFDRNGEIRVRRSDRIARRSAVALDRQGRVLLLVTEGAYTLWETGVLLRESGWDLVQALALDGGNEASLIVESNGVRYRSFENDRSGTDVATLVTLPAILAVRPAGAPAHRP
ncbi:MAG TPA: phosphodiester glycosidase family protein [Dongiaceae bacterium]|jgi:uncharacterized protein YigE (DUF2233 family)|nr:phosphodiester glycosidase family protein [Dongiaceae bacterium]